MHTACSCASCNALSLNGVYLHGVTWNLPSQPGQEIWPNTTASTPHSGTMTQIFHKVRSRPRQHSLKDSVEALTLEGQGIKVVVVPGRPQNKTFKGGPSLQMKQEHASKSNPDGLPHVAGCDLWPTSAGRQSSNEVQVHQLTVPHI